MQTSEDVRALQQRWDAAPETDGTLTDLQLQTIDLLCAGASYTYIVENLPVGRTTLYRWRTEDVAFQTAYEQRQAEIVEERRLRLVGLIDRALDVIDENLREGDPDIAMEILRMTGPEAIRRSMNTSPVVIDVEMAGVDDEEGPERPSLTR